ncbi:MAG: DUF4160 domain-containing protein [Streptosporangiaceae bacterium]
MAGPGAGVPGAAASTVGDVAAAWGIAGTRAKAGADPGAEHRKGPPAARGSEGPRCLPPGYRHVMPRVSAFYGVVIYMYWNERDHPVAHFHACHAGRRASVSVDGNVLAGSLDARALQFVRE